MIKVEKTNTSDYRFVVQSETGSILLRSIPFENKTEIEKTVMQLSKEEKLLNFFERKTNFDGKFLFEIKNKDGKIIGSSELYSSEAGMENGIKNLKGRLKL